jgi:hypothetical protein
MEIKEVEVSKTSVQNYEVVQGPIAELAPFNWNVVAVNDENEVVYTVAVDMGFVEATLFVQELRFLMKEI